MYGNWKTSTQQGKQRDWAVFPLVEYPFSALKCFISTGPTVDGKQPRPCANAVG